MDFENQVCINNMTYRRYSFHYFLESVKRLGIKNIELSGCHPHYTIYEGEQINVSSLAKEIKNAGIRVLAIEPEQNFLPVNIASHNEYLRKESVRQIQFYIENAAAFDCDQVIVYPGKKIMDYPNAEAKKYCCESLYELEKTAARCGASLLLQNVSRCISGLTPDSAAVGEIIDEVGGKNLGISVNTCAVCAGGETLDNYFERFGEKIKAVQISDSDDEDEQLVLGEGNQDIRQHIDVLDKWGYEGPVALEITMEEYADGAEKFYAESIRVLKKVLKGGCKI
ncbi:MAG: sugar phosphate isomerase/epimerase [Dorea sp.]|jgi:protein FrlC|nr:sugar phosphate isomerase/epimerase [Dorea sp.]